MTNIITKKSITNVACCMVEELLEMMSPMPVMVRMKSPVKRRMFRGFPRPQAVDEPCEQYADHQREDADYPEGYQFGEDEREFRYGRYVYLLDGAELLFLYDIDCGHEAAQKHDDHNHQAGNHRVLVVQQRVVHVFDEHFEPGNERRSGLCRGGFARRELRREHLDVGAAQYPFGGVHRIDGDEQVGRTVPDVVFLDPDGISTMRSAPPNSMASTACS